MHKGLRGFLAVADLARADAVRVWPAATLTLIVLQLGVRVAAYLVPPLGPRDTVLVRARHEEFALVGLGAVVIALWLSHRYSDGSPWLSRLCSRWKSVATDALSCLLLLGTTLGLWALFSLDRISPLHTLRSSASVARALLPFVALAPALGRVRLTPPLFVLLLILLLGGVLGFFGRHFPLHADTVFEVGASGACWVSDVMATTACLLISLGLTHRR